MQIITAYNNWLECRGITEQMCVEKGVHWNDEGALTIPIRDREGRLLFNKYRRNPLISTGPKYLYDKGSKSALFGAENIDYADTVILCEGELDALFIADYFSEYHGVIPQEARKVTGVSTTGGCGYWNTDWNELLINKNVIICYDADEPGIKGALKVLQKIPWAKIMFLPKNVKQSPKDITEFYQSLEGPYSTSSQKMFMNSFYPMIKSAIRIDVPVTSVLEKEKKQLQKDWLERLQIANKNKEDNYWIKTVLDHVNALDTYKPVDPKLKIIKDHGGDLTIAKQYPIPNLVTVTRKKMVCLWHDDSHPSMEYYPDKNRAYCFVCAKSADVVDICMKLNNLSFNQAVNYLTGK